MNTMKLLVRQSRTRNVLPSEKNTIFTILKIAKITYFYNDEICDFY